MTTAQPVAIPDDALASVPLQRDRLVLTITEAAEVLGISRAFAYELAARGELPVIRLGQKSGWESSTPWCAGPRFPSLPGWRAR